MMHWLLTDKGDQDARALADEHYSRQTKGSPQFTRNGQNLVFITRDISAVWVTHRPAPGIAHRPDGLQAWECTLFRNVGPVRSSELIREAVLLTWAVWGEPPADGLITHVDPTKIRSELPGYCFRRAGWKHVGTSGHGAFMRFRAPRPAVIPAWSEWVWRGERGGKLRAALQPTAGRATAGEENTVKKKEAPAKGAVKRSPASSAKTKAKAAPSSTPASEHGEQRVIWVPVDQIRRDPTQPRKTFDTSDIEATIEVRDGQPVEGRGIIHPLLVLQVGGVTPYELFDGERRWRAAKAKGLLEVPCLVEQIPFEHVLEKQVALGVAQKGLLPFEIADALQHLQSTVKTKGRKRLSADELALRVGLTSGRQVHRFLALATLCSEARQAFDAGTISLATALELATISNVELQAEATREVGKRGTREAKWMIADRYHLRLAPSTAGFDPADASLPGGACGACPKSTASQRRLWVDSDGEEDEDRCTDRSCFEAKKASTWERRKAQAESTGAKVLAGKAAQELYPNPWDRTPSRDDLLDLDQVAEIDEEAAEKENRDTRTWRELLGASAAPAIVAKDQRGGVRELVTVDQVCALLEQSGNAQAAEKLKKEHLVDGDENAGKAKPQNNYKLERTALNEAGAKALSAILAAVENLDPIDVWRFLAETLCRQEFIYNGDGGLAEFAARRGLIAPNDGGEEWNLNALMAWLASPGLSPSEARDLVIESVICRESFPLPKAKESSFIQACDFAGVDYLELVNEHRVAAGLEAIEPEVEEDEEEAPPPEQPALSGPIAVACPECKAKIGAPCAGKNKSGKNFHKKRVGPSPA